MAGLLTLLSVLLWWVLYSSIGALLAALIATAVLRWAERSAVVFNRVYLACLSWNLVGFVLGFAAAWHQGALRPPYGALLASPWFRGALALNMAVGAFLLWRLIPRVDAHRLRPANACLAAAVVTAVGYGIATSLA